MATEQPPALDIGQTACDVQFLLRRITHLVRALHDASDDVQITEDVTSEAVSRICAFADVIGETAKVACEKAEQIERGDVRARKAA